MPKKRTSPGSSKDEQTKQSSDLFQQDDNAKRARLTSSSDTTLHDLPIELVECILVEAVVMEVKGMKLAKSVWKEKAGPVISRLRTVCSHWNSILTTNSFRTKLHRTLDGIAQETIRLEILHRSPTDLFIIEITKLKDEIFVLGMRLGKDDETDEDDVLDEDDGPYKDVGLFNHAIFVYERSNMAKVKDVIPLPGMDAKEIAGCSVSNCVYILDIKKCYHMSIRRITKDDEHQFNISPVIDDMWLPNPSLSTTATGNLILFRRQKNKLPMLNIYGANGSLQYKLKLSFDIPWFQKMIPKSNGNLVFVSRNDDNAIKLTEIDMDGTILRQYESSVRGACQADNYGRILITDWSNKIELVDSEFNPLEFSDPQLNVNVHISLDGLHYNSDNNETVAILDDEESETNFLTVFHFIEG